MNKKKTKIVLVVTLLLISVSFLSGCTRQNAISTWGWEHANDEGTGARLWGRLASTENFHNWNAWFVYDKVSHDNWEDYENRVEADNYSGLNFFSVDVFGLDRPDEYHYRAVGEYQGQGSTISVGIDNYFIPGGPVVATENASNIMETSVQLNGRLYHMGGASTCEVFFKYGSDKDNLNIETDHQTLSSIADFNQVITDLTSCKSYYFQAIAINDVDTEAGLIFEVIPGQPIVDTYLPTAITSSTAIFHGTLWQLGGPATCEVWFEYGDDNPNNLDESTPHQVVDSTGAFVASVEGLKPATTYWVQAVSDNHVCSDRGEIKEFKTGSFIGEKGYTINHQKTSLKDRILNLIEKQYGNIDAYTLQMLQKKFPILSKILDIKITS